MRTQLSMFDATSITIQEKRGDDADDSGEVIWTDLVVSNEEGDQIEFTIFDCPPIQIGHDNQFGSHSQDVIADLKKERTDAMNLNHDLLDARKALNTLRADYRTEVLRSQDRLRRAEAAEQACGQLRAQVENLEAENQAFIETVNMIKAELAGQIDANSDLCGQLNDANSELRTMRGTLDDLEARGAA